MWDGIERRRFPRVQYPCLITLRKNTSPALSILTHTEDIGVGGVRVLIHTKIEVPTEVDLEIDLMDTLANIFSRGKISWVKEIFSRQKGKDKTQTFKGQVSWVKEIPPQQQGEGPRYDTGINFIAIKNEDKKRIEKIVNHILGKRS
ncbi:MAG: PilZ domain-containing protein [Candidatus Omnitrophica bacterium]|nr:PilZ domain-containing protein [Candidatus Omnitrophota bacterium]